MVDRPLWVEGWGWVHGSMSGLWVMTEGRGRGHLWWRPALGLNFLYSYTQPLGPIRRGSRGMGSRWHGDSRENKCKFDTTLKWRIENRGSENSWKARDMTTQCNMLPLIECRIKKLAIKDMRGPLGKFEYDHVLDNIVISINTFLKCDIKGYGYIIYPYSLYMNYMERDMRKCCKILSG